MAKKIKLTEKDLTRIIKKVISEQGDDKDVILERLLVEAQRLMRFIADAKKGKLWKGNWSNEDLSSIQENINTEITNYLN